jgi:hypothetical protein
MRLYRSSKQFQKNTVHLVSTTHKKSDRKLRAEKKIRNYEMAGKVMNKVMCNSDTSHWLQPDASITLIKTERQKTFAGIICGIVGILEKGNWYSESAKK